MAKDEPDQPDATSEEAALKAAHAELAKAAERAAEAGQGLIAAKMKNVPDMIVRVLDGQTVSHDGQTYYGVGYSLDPEGEDREEGETLTVPGPVGISLFQLGHVSIEGSVKA